MLKRIIILTFLMGILAAGFYGFALFVIAQLEVRPAVISSKLEAHNWKVQSIDASYYSRDLAPEGLTDQAYPAEVERQVGAIAKTGATHIAIGTPYDEKYLPIIKLWVSAARQQGLNVWFRGNWSGWEGWFGSKKDLSREAHIQKTKDFILKNSDLFSSGDLFSSCPACENGGPVDMHSESADIESYRKFITDEYAVTKAAFREVNKNVQSNCSSMNSDLARVVMDKETTKKMDGVVSIDYYTKKSDDLISNVESVANGSGGKVLLDEWGVAKLEINGEMSSSERAQWISDALYGLSLLQDKMIGMNYWQAVGGPTALWSENADVSEVSLALQNYYASDIIYGQVTDEIGHPIVGAKVAINNKEVYTENDGYFELKSAEKISKIVISADGFRQMEMDNPKSIKELSIVLTKENKTLYDKLLLWSRKVVYQ